MIMIICQIFPCVHRQRPYWNFSAWNYKAQDFVPSHPGRKVCPLLLLVLNWENPISNCQWKESEIALRNMKFNKNSYSLGWIGKYQIIICTTWYYIFYNLELLCKFLAPWSISRAWSLLFRSSWTWWQILWQSWPWWSWSRKSFTFNGLLGDFDLSLRDLMVRR